MPTQPSPCLNTFHQVEAERTHLLTHLETWPTDSLSFRPAPTAWSAVEVLDHIVRAETGTIADVQLGLQTPHLLGTAPRPRIAELDRALRSEQRFRVPATAQAIHPDTQTTLPDVLLRWQNTRTQAHALLEDLTPTQATCGVFHHPWAGWMTFQEVLEHFSAHLEHHRFQLSRIRATWESQHA